MMYVKYTSAVRLNYDPSRKRPIQIYLRDDQLRSLRAVAETRGESLASLIRQGVDKFLEDIPPEDDPLQTIVGFFDSAEGDLAQKHDEYLIRSKAQESGDETWGIRRYERLDRGQRSARQI